MYQEERHAIARSPSSISGRIRTTAVADWMRNAFCLHRLSE